MKKSFEINFDGLVGPTHHYGGLSYGNTASTIHKAQISNPRQAALQGLAKMKTLAGLGLKQGFFPPQPRPDLDLLRRLGFKGKPAQMIESAWKISPQIVSACYSSSSMWTANAATVAPSSDTADGKVHFTPANLNSQFHRSIEAPFTGQILKTIFHDEHFFNHHDALPNTSVFGDEGAANHSRLCRQHGDEGVHFFVFGRSAFDAKYPSPTKYPARQTLEASMSIARLHQLDPKRVVYGHQNPSVIDQGAFHNDVVAVANQNTLFYHEEAYLNKADLLAKLNEHVDLIPIEVRSNQISIEDAVKSYLFNSQLLSLASGDTLLVAPIECEENLSVSNYLRSTFSQIRYFDLRQSMRNGGGPACLRLRVVLNQEELTACHPQFFIDDKTHTALSAWVNKHYRDRLSLEDLRDPKLLDETLSAYDELYTVIISTSLCVTNLSSSAIV